jgi:hypothetical protein
MPEAPHAPAIRRITSILADLHDPSSPSAGMFTAELGAPTVPAVLDTSLADSRHVADQVASGALREVRPGVLLPAAVVGADPAGHDETLLAEVRGVLAASRSRLWFSHATAARLLGAWTYATPCLVDVTHTFKPHVAGGREPLVRRHFTTLPPRERATVGGIPVTSPERTLVDCLRTLTPAGGLAVADSLFRLGADPAEVSRIMTASAGKRGMVRARRLLELCDPRSGSPGESVARLVAADDGLPRPVCQIPVVTASGTWYVDFGWPDVGLGVEFDGAVKYAGGRYGDPEMVRRRQERRAAAILDAGYELVRVGWSELADPLTLGHTLRAAYTDAWHAARSEGGRRSAPGPALTRAGLR